MSEVIKPTPGPWVTEKSAGDEWWFGGRDGGEIVVRSVGDKHGAIAVMAASLSSEGAVDADFRLIAEAGTVFHESGLTPRQLVERAKELEELLNGVLLMGRGTSGRIIVEGWQEEVLRAALSKALPNTVAEVKE